MDEATIRQYDLIANEIALFHSSIAPIRLYRLVKLYFTPDGLTLDVGCGIGRDCNWLLNNGFPVCGVDASNEMLLKARHTYPYIPLILDSLPNLASIKDGTFSNVFCSAVLMHLSTPSARDALKNLLRIMCENGTLILSYRNSVTDSEREFGKLYSNFDKKILLDDLQRTQASVLLDESKKDSSRNVVWENIVIRKKI